MIMEKTLVTMIAVAILSSPFFSREELTFENMTVEQKAEECGMTTDEFVFLSSVVEAESDRNEESAMGRRYVCLVILNRVNDDRFPNTITEVLTAPGQFSTVRHGKSVAERTLISDRAVIETVRWMNSGEEYPNVMYFNCRGFFAGREPYPNPNGGDDIGGNYFSLGD